MVKRTKDMKGWVLGSSYKRSLMQREFPTAESEEEKCPSCGRHVSSNELLVNEGKCDICTYGEY